MVLFGFLLFSRMTEPSRTEFYGSPVNSKYFNCRIQLIVLGVLGLITGIIGELLSYDETNIAERIGNIFHSFLTIIGLLFSCACALLNLNYLVLNLVVGNFCDPLVSLGSTITAIYVSAYFGQTLSLPVFYETFPDESNENDKPKNMIIV